MPTVTKKPGMLSKSDLQFQIGQLRLDKQIHATISIQVSFIAVLTAVFLPEILFRTVFGNGTSAMNPEILSWVPTISYAVAASCFVYCAVANMMKWTKIRQLERMLEMAK